MNNDINNGNQTGNVTTLNRQTAKATVEVLGDALIATDGSAFVIRNLGGLTGLDTGRSFQRRDDAINYIADYVAERAKVA